MNLHGRPRLVPSVADVFQRTLGAFWFAGDAESSSVMDDLVGIINPFVLRDDFHQVLLNTLWFFTASQLQSARDAMHVRVYHHADAFPEPGTQHHVGRFSRCAGE